MECYGPAYSEELTAEIYDKSFEERKRYITDYLQKTQLIGKLEEELKKTKKMALTEAELITPGSGYGAFRKEYARTGHLKFVKKTKADEAAMKRYRQLMKENKNEPKAKQQLSIMYALSAILVIFVLVAGAARLQSEKNTDINASQPESGGDYVDNASAVNGTPSAVPDETLNVDYANGNVDTTQAEPESTSDEPSSDMQTDETQGESQSDTESVETTTEETTEETTAEPETTQGHRTYVVQEGDTLYGIIKKEYGSEDQQKLQELFDLNGITDGGNSIAPGDELLLP